MEEVVSGMQEKNPILYICTAVDRIVKITSAVAMSLQAIFMILLALQIFLRYFLNSPIYGIEESVTAMVVWFAAFGAAAVTYANGHAQVEYFLSWFPKKWHKWLQGFVNLLGAFLGGILVDGGVRLFMVQKVAMPQGGLPFSKCYYYALPIIVLGIMMIIVCVCRIIKLFGEKEKAREGGDII